MKKSLIIFIGVAVIVIAATAVFTPTPESQWRKSVDEWQENSKGATQSHGLKSVVWGFISKSPPQAQAGLDVFAQCLKDKGIAMYGANWCPHCQNQKKAFGKSFRFVSYVECPEVPKKCLSAGINGYPTWIFPDGKRLEGTQSIEKLSQESGCVLTSNTTE